MPGEQVVVDHPPRPCGLPGAHDPGGFEELPVGERVAVSFAVRSQVVGGLTDPRPDDERERGVLQRVEVGCRQHPGVGDDDHVRHLVAFGEAAQDGEQGGCLGGVALEAGHLQREPGRVDE